MSAQNSWEPIHTTIWLENWPTFSQQLNFFLQIPTTLNNKYFVLHFILHFPYRHLYSCYWPIARNDWCGHFEWKWGRSYSSYWCTGRFFVMTNKGEFIPACPAFEIMYTANTIVKGKLIFLSVVISLQLDGQVIALLVQNLDRLDENVKEDSDGVHNTLGIFSIKCHCCLVVWLMVIFIIIASCCP